jgi:hypothetical protein
MCLLTPIALAEKIDFIDGYNKFLFEATYNLGIRNSDFRWPSCSANLKTLTTLNKQVLLISEKGKICKPITKNLSCHFE